MIRRTLFIALCLAAVWTVFDVGNTQAQQPQSPQSYNRQWGRTYNTQDWNRFYHYPYVYYPQNFWGEDYYRSSDDMYHRYPSEMRVPVYNKAWQNEYPEDRRYYHGHHFNLDVF